MKLTPSRMKSRPAARFVEKTVNGPIRTGRPRSQARRPSWYRSQNQAITNSGAAVPSEYVNSNDAPSTGRKSNVLPNNSVRLVKAYAKKAGRSRALHGARSESTPPANAAANETSSIVAYPAVLSSEPGELGVNRLDETGGRQRADERSAVQLEGWRGVDAIGSARRQILLDGCEGLASLLTGREHTGV